MKPLLVCALLSLPALSAAKVDPRFSSVDAVVFGDVDGTRTFRVQLRTVDNAPDQGIVTLDFSGTSVRLETTQEAGTTVDCVARTLSRETPTQGQPGYGLAVFHPRFGGASGTVRVTGDGIRLADVPARSTDVDGDATVGLRDVATFAGPFLDGTPHPELDFDGSGERVGLGDFALLVQGFLGGAKASYCP